MDWIGFRLVISNVRPLQAVVVSVQPATQKELLEMIGDFWHRNVLTIKEVRKFAGKVSNVARLLLGWRPFLFELWAALAAADRAKSRRVWTRQIRPALAWFRAFLREEEVGICRSFRLNAYREPSDCVSITIDASPFGMGAHLCRNGKPCEYFAVELSADDVAIFEYQIGDSAGQQTWECLAALVAVRIWSRYWREDRTSLSVKGDNGALLTMVDALKTTGPGTSMVGRELALVIARACYKPRVACHLPGVANVVADGLSRRFQPEYAKGWRPHQWLAGAVEVHPPRRDRAWYATMVPPRVVPLKPAKGGLQGRPKRRRQRARQPAK